MSSAQDRTASGATPAAGGPGAHRETASYPEPGYAGGTAGYGNGMAETGYTILAAALMMLDGLWNFFVGLVAIIRQSFYVSHPNYEFHWNLHAWGWLHFALGIVIFAAGACVLLGQTWAKLLGIVLAVFSGLAAFLFLPYYPFWSIVVLALDVFVIWALATSIAHSRRAA
jgi:hypothetical protein